MLCAKYAPANMTLEIRLTGSVASAQFSGSKGEEKKAIADKMPMTANNPYLNLSAFISAT